MPAQTHCAGKTGDKRCSPAHLRGRVWKTICRLSLRGTPLGSAQDGWGPLAAGEGPAPQAFFSVYHSRAGLQGVSAPCASVLPFVGAFFSTAQAQACQPGFAPQGDFLPDEKVTKESPKAGPSPALWNPPRGTGCPCVLLFAALGLVGSHRWFAVLWFGFTSLFMRPSTARALPWLAAVPSDR